MIDCSGFFFVASDMDHTYTIFVGRVIHILVRDEVVKMEQIEIGAFDERYAWV